MDLLQSQVTKQRGRAGGAPAARKDRESISGIPSRKHCNPYCKSYRSIN
jgi:hypothetical protein